MTTKSVTHRVSPEITKVQKISAILWPSFIFAGAANSVFFTFLDPFKLFECTGTAPFSRIGAYSVGFLLFWLLCALSSLTTAYFLKCVPRIARLAPSDGPNQG